MAKVSMLDQNLGPDNVASPETGSIEDQGNPSAMPSRHSSITQRKAPINAHMRALQSFLLAHMENIRSLQGSLSTPGAEIYAKRSTGKKSPAYQCFFFFHLIERTVSFSYP